VLQIDPGARLTLIGSGTTAAVGGDFTASLTVPYNPSLIGTTAFAQGVLYPFDGHAARLTVNAVSLTVH
jgi:hypothetical protein